MEEQRPLREGSPPVIHVEQPGFVTLCIPEDDDPNHLSPVSNMKKSSSMTSIMCKIREKREKFRQNQCAGIIFFLILGTVLNIFACFASLWSAHLEAEMVKSAVENEHTFRFKLKKKLVEEPSKFLIGLLNYGGRILSAVGTVLLVQVISTYVKRRRYNLILKSAAEEADTVISDVHVGITDTAGECCLAFWQTAS